jgi:hypothetical protein
MVLDDSRVKIEVFGSCGAKVRRFYSLKSKLVERLKMELIYFSIKLSPGVVMC